MAQPGLGWVIEKCLDFLKLEGTNHRSTRITRPNGEHRPVYISSFGRNANLLSCSELVRIAWLCIQANLARTLWHTGRARDKCAGFGVVSDNVNSH
jgi:hypothetical protein